MKLRELKENPNMNPIVKYILIALASVGVVGATVFGIYRNNQIKEAATQQEVIQDATDPSLLNDKSGQETIDVDALAEIYYNENKDNIKSDTTLEDWTKVFKDYWASTNADESATVRNCLNYFALDTLTAEDVENGKTIELTPEEQAVINLEMNGEEDDATEEESVETVETVETVEVETNEATTEASTTDASTDTITNKKDYEIEYYDNVKTMYAIRSVNIRKGPNADDFEKVGSLKTNEAIEVIGVVEEYNGEDTFWLVVKRNGEQRFVSGAYLSDKKIDTTSSSSNTSSSNNSSNNRPSNKSTQSFDPNRHANESSTYGRPKGVSGPPADIPVEQATGPTDCGATGINWH